MTLINLICPHCGGEFELDPDRSLQSFWTCPYCGNKSLMQMSDGKLRLRGIISSRSDQGLKTNAPEKTDEDKRIDAVFQSVVPVPEAEQSNSMPPTEPSDDVSESLVQDIPDQFEEASDIPAADEIPTQNDPVEESVEEAPAVTPDSDAAQSEEAVIDSAVDIQEAPVEEMPSIMSEPEAEPFKTPVIASVTDERYVSDNHEEPIEESPENIDDILTEEIADAPKADEDKLEALCRLAQKAANQLDYPRFNAYSRQAIDILPTEGRIYALRSRLIEQANGFSRHTWAVPGWFQLTPGQMAEKVAQHLYNYSTAMKYSDDALKGKLPEVIAKDILRQAIDLCNELGEIRCKKRIAFRTFKGRYSRRDLLVIRDLTEALQLIDSRSCPDGAEQLIDALRIEILKAPKGIAKRLKMI